MTRPTAPTAPTTPPARVKRRELVRMGTRGDVVRAVVDQRRGGVIVYYRDRAGVPHKKHYPLGRAGQSAAIAWAQSYHAERERLARVASAPKPATLDEIWRRYIASPNWRALRAATRIGYANRWRKWTLFLGDQFIANDTEISHVDNYITSASDAGMAINQVRQVITVARVVYNWAQTRKLIQSNDLAPYRWKSPDGAQVLAPGEFTEEEYLRILRRFDPQDPRQWRFHAALMLLAGSGQRTRAVLHLRWRDIDWDAGRIVWPAEYQKQKVSLDRAVTWEIVAALCTARYWREHAATELRRRRDRLPASHPERVADADWVLFAQNDKAAALSYTSMHTQLRAAEDAEGIAHQDYRAMHAFRRLAVGTIGAETGDPMRGLEYIGDNDPKQLAKYDKRKQQRVDEATDVLDQARQRSPKTARNPSLKPDLECPSPPAMAATDTGSESNED